MPGLLNPVNSKPTPAKDLLASLETHNATFESLLALIPPKYYLSSEYHDDVQGEGHGELNKFQKHSKKLKEVDEARKRERRKEKLDPDNQKSVVELQNQKTQRKAKPGSKARSKNKSGQEQSDSDVDIDVEFSSDDDDDDEQQLSPALDTNTLTPMPPSAGIAALREKLHARMANLRHGRGRNSGPDTGAGGGEKGVGTSGREALLEERRAQRALMRERRRKETKERIRKGKMPEGAGQSKDEDKHSGTTKSKDKHKQKDKEGGRSTNSRLSQPQLLVPDTHASISFPIASSSKSQSKQRSKNPSQALSKLTSHLEHLSSLPESARADVETRERWEKAEARMEGGKVYDDPAKLKVAIKKREVKKDKSAKSWEERKEQVTQSMAAKQQKRTDNIAMRNERRKNKGKHSAGKTGGIKGKAGKSRPGFEGKTFGKAKAKTKGKS